MLRTLIGFLSILLLVTFISCKKSTTPANPIVNFSASLNGANETPANSTTGVGTANATFNNDTKILTVTTTYSGTTGDVKAGHIHKGAVGVSGPVLFPFTTVASPITFTSAPLDATQEADLKANLYYVNLHTALYPGGEIRGQLIMQ